MRDYEHEYDTQLTRLANTLRALADEVEREGQRWRTQPPSLSRQSRPDRVWCASEVQNVVLRWLGRQNSDLVCLWYAAVRAEHATARETPAVLLDKAATALADRNVPMPETLADAALRGAGVIR